MASEDIEETEVLAAREADWPRVLALVSVMGYDARDVFFSKQVVTYFFDWIDPKDWECWCMNVTLDKYQIIVRALDYEQLIKDEGAKRYTSIVAFTNEEEACEYITTTYQKQRNDELGYERD